MVGNLLLTLAADAEQRANSLIEPRSRSRQRAPPGRIQYRPPSAAGAALAPSSATGTRNRSLIPNPPAASHLRTGDTAGPAEPRPGPAESSAPWRQASTRQTRSGAVSRERLFQRGLPCLAVRAIAPPHIPCDNADRRLHHRAIRGVGIKGHPASMQCQRARRMAALGILEALIPGRMQGHSGTAEVPWRQAG